jgi:hypothetical protein
MNTQPSIPSPEPASEPAQALTHDQLFNSEWRTLCAERRAARIASAKAERERLSAEKAAKVKARRDATLKRRKEKKAASRVAKQRKARKCLVGRAAALAVVRWAYWRAYDAKLVQWKDYRNWRLRLFRQIEKQVVEKTADRVGSLADVVKNDLFYREVARRIFECYCKVGSGPDVSEIQSRVVFDLDWPAK